MVSKCCVPGCRSRVNKFKLFLGPYTNKPRWTEWCRMCPFLKTLQPMQLQNARFCSLHFKPEHINRLSLEGPHNLSKDAVPMLKLPKTEQNDSVLSLVDQNLQEDPNTNLDTQQKDVAMLNLPRNESNDYVLLPVAQNLQEKPYTNLDTQQKNAEINIQASKVTDEPSKKTLKKAWRKCCIPECSSSTDTVKFMALPADKNLFELWAAIISYNSKVQLQFGSNKNWICVRHFEAKAKKARPDGRRVHYSVPTLFTEEEMACGVPRKPYKINWDSIIKKSETEHSGGGTGGTKLHLFPHPEKDKDRFITWVNAVGSDITSLDPQYIYVNRVICSDHFEERYKTWTGRLSNVAVPTLLMPDSHRTLHIFPNPTTDRERFNEWVYAVKGDIVALSNADIYKLRRVCHAHFEEKFRCRFNRISNIAMPTLNLPGPSALPTTYTERRLMIRRSAHTQEANEIQLIEAGSSLTSTFLAVTRYVNLDHTYHQNISQDRPRKSKGHQTKSAKDNNSKTAQTINIDAIEEDADDIENLGFPKDNIEYFENEGVLDEDTSREETASHGGAYSWQRESAMVPCGEDDDTCVPAADMEVTMFDSDSDDQPLDNSIHKGFKCNHCLNDITGFRYTCVVCADYDLCGACEARREHPHHYVLRIPHHRPYNEIQMVLQTIRRALLCDSIVNVSGTMANDDDFEIKEEVEVPDPIEVEEATVEQTVEECHSELDELHSVIEVHTEQQKGHINLEDVNQRICTKEKHMDLQQRKSNTELLPEDTSIQRDNTQRIRLEQFIIDHDPKSPTRQYRKRTYQYRIKEDTACGSETVAYPEDLQRTREKERKDAPYLQSRAHNLPVLDSKLTSKKAQIVLPRLTEEILKQFRSPAMTKPQRTKTYVYSAKHDGKMKRVFPLADSL